VRDRVPHPNKTTVIITVVICTRYVMHLKSSKGHISIFDKIVIKYFLTG